MEPARLRGVVQSGRGLASDRMVGAGLERWAELAGFPVVPGTLNVRLAEPLRGAAPRRVSSSMIGRDWGARTGQAGYFLVPVLIAERYRGIAFQADEPGYPADQVELVSEVPLRETLRLRDGDSITFSLL